MFFYLYSSTCTSNLGRSWPTTNSAITIFFFLMLKVFEHPEADDSISRERSVEVSGACCILIVINPLFHASDELKNFFLLPTSLLKIFHLFNPIYSIYYSTI